MRSGRSDRLKQFGRVFAVNLLSIVALLVAADLYLSWKGLQPYRRTYPGEYQGEEGVRWARADPHLGWTINSDILPGEINPQGFRDTKDFENPPREGRARVMMLGDSFVVGSRLVQSDRILPALVRARLGDGYDVFNLAVAGWGVDQMYLAYERYKKAIAPDFVVLAFIDDDVKRVLEAYRTGERLTKPSFTVEGGALTERDARRHSPPALDRLFGRSVILSMAAREWYLAADARPVVGHIFRNIARDMQISGGRLVILRIPTRDDDHLATRLRRRLYDFASEVAGLEEATYLDAGDAITTKADWKSDLYIEDGHLNAKGNDLLVDYLVGRGFDHGRLVTTRRSE
jgi:GDSL-like lipase/acylhydrolase family protein